MGLPTSLVPSMALSCPPKIARATPAKLWWEANDVALQVCTLAGGPSMASPLAATCKALHKAVVDAWGELAARFPQRIFVAGGLDASFNPVSTVWRLEPPSRVWDLLPSLSAPCAGPTAVLVQGQLYVLGGELAGDAVKDVQRYDANTGSWQMLPPMQEGRSRAAAVALGSYIYVLGGFDGLRALQSAERYNLRTNTWETLPPMHRPRYACSAAAQPLGCVLAFGGELTDAGVAASMERFDPNKNAWELLPPVVRTPACGAAIALTGSGRTAFTMGGLGLSGQALPSAEWLFLGPTLAAPTPALGEKEDPEANRLTGTATRVQAPAWTSLPAMETPRHLASASGFGSGVVAVGGKGPTFEVVADVEVFDPVTNTWDRLPALPCARFRAAVVSGRV